MDDFFTLDITAWPVVSLFAKSPLSFDFLTIRNCLLLVCFPDLMRRVTYVVQTCPLILSVPLSCPCILRVRISCLSVYPSFHNSSVLRNKFCINLYAFVIFSVNITYRTLLFSTKPVQWRRASASAATDCRYFRGVDTMLSCSW
jgi:hypothetical protein